MKIRIGFVSNSSTSSFIVEHYDKYPPNDLSHPRWLLNRNEIRKLKRKGFVWTGALSSLQTLDLEYEEFPPPNKYVRNLGYWVPCNQDEVITWLVKSKISFSACTQYGETHVFYDKDKDYLVVAENFGNSMEIYGYDIKENKDSTKYQKRRKPIRKVDIKKYLAGKEYV